MRHLFVTSLLLLSQFLLQSAWANAEDTAYEALQKGRYADAIAQYQQLLKEQPQQLAWWYNLGLAYQQLKKWSEAAQVFEKVRQADPNYPGIHTALGTIQAQQREWVPAIRSFDKALELNPFDLAAAYNLAIACEQKENVQKSLYGKYELLKKRIRAYQRILEFKTDVPIQQAFEQARKERATLERTQAENLKVAPRELLPPPEAIKSYQQGNAWSQHQQWAKALKSYQEALAYHPTYGDALFAVGMLYWQQGQIQNANTYFLYTISVMPSHVGAYYHLGLSYQKLNRGPEAIEAFHNALYYRPSYAPAQQALLTTLQQLGKSQERMRLLEQIVAVDHSNPDWRNQLGQWYWHNQQVGQARQHWLKLTEEHPTYAPAWYHLGRLYQQTGQARAASASYAQALNLSANRPEFYGDLAQYHLGQNHLTEALHYAKLSLQHQPNHVGSLLMAGSLLSQQEQLAPATVYLEKARGLAPQQAQVYKPLGWLYLKKGAKSSALQALQRYLQLAPQASDRADIQQLLQRLANEK